MSILGYVVDIGCVSSWRGCRCGRRSSRLAVASRIVLNLVVRGAVSRRSDDSTRIGGELRYNAATKYRLLV